MPQAFASEVPGIHNQPPERAVVPPKRGSFSTIRTSRPRQRAVIAADIPEQPDPATSTSHSYVSPASRSLPVMWASLLEQRTFGLGDRAEGILALHRLDDLKVIPGFFGLLGCFHLGEIHVANDAAV